MKRPVSLSRAISIAALLVLRAASSSACDTGSATITNLPAISTLSFQVFGLNPAGKLTGFLSISGVHPEHAFLYDSGTLTDFGTLGGPTSEGLAINASGQIVGQADVAANQPHAFVTSSGTLQDLGTLGGPRSSAVAINDPGVIVGTSDLPNAAGTVAFIYNGTMTSLGTLGGNSSSPFALNNSAVVVGQSTTAGGATHAFVYSNAPMFDLGTLGGNYSAAFAINDAGLIVGESSDTNSDTHGFVYSGGVMTDLGTFGGTMSTAYLVNSNGQAIGYASIPGDLDFHGLFYSNGTVTDLGTLGGTTSFADGINNLGQVVGDALTATGDDHAFLWQNGQMTDLNTLLPANSDFVLQIAIYINDAGRIVGTGTNLDGSIIWFIMDLGTGGNPPVANAGPNQTVDCQTQVTLDGSASTGSQPLSFVWTSGSSVLGTTPQLSVSLPLGSNIVTLKVTDSCGASSETNITIVVADNTPPKGSCPADLTVSADSHCQALVPNFASQVGASDNCTPPQSLVITQDLAVGLPVGLGPHPVVITVTDSSGNSSTCKVLFTVVDTTPPVILSAPAPFNLSAGADCQVQVPNVLLNVVASDSCTPVDQLLKTQNPPATSLIGIGSHMILVTVTDGSGNTSSTNVSFTVSDTTPPTILSSPGPVNVSADANCQGLVPNVLSGVLATDNCTPANQLVMSQSPAAGTLLGPGQYTITVTVTDVSGNSASVGVPLTITACTYGVLQLGNGKVSISSGGVNGDVAVGPNGAFSISGSSFVMGALSLSPGDAFSRSGSALIGNIVSNADLSAAIGSALTTASADAALPCFQTFTTWNSSTTITGGPGTNVVCVQNVTLQGGSHITLTGPSTAKFIINVRGSLSMSGSSTIRVGGSVSPNEVIYNVIGTGNDVVLSGGSAVDGTILAVSRNVTLSAGVTNGRLICGKNLVISGAKIN